MWSTFGVVVASCVFVSALPEGLGCLPLNLNVRMNERVPCPTPEESKQATRPVSSPSSKSYDITVDIGDKPKQAVRPKQRPRQPVANTIATPVKLPSNENMLSLESFPLLMELRKELNMMEMLKRRMIESTTEHHVMIDSSESPGDVTMRITPPPAVISSTGGLGSFRNDTILDQTNTLDSSTEGKRVKKEWGNLDDHPALRPLVKKCREKVPLTDKVLMEAEAANFDAVADDRDLQCYARCIFVTAKAMDFKGQIDLRPFISGLVPGAKEYYGNRMLTCQSTVDDPDQCKKAFKMYQCFKEQHGDKYYFV